MYLKKLAMTDGFLTVSYRQKGATKTCTGRVHSLNIKDQILSLKDSRNKLHLIHLSGIQTIESFTHQRPI
ncbi:hypothetical protein M3181_06035 [Mesobacillus maritimus]|uniref:hypothetical protein n=1 Tax=Mesobacillus maritimus TaxID=1643336 RepID=UPI00203D783F|nr:hypothetical protein [Mesobacillus maritimus]MCM3668560.1 hypothetical protein [Mesobacillus maritimus]